MPDQLTPKQSSPVIKFSEKKFQTALRQIEAMANENENDRIGPKVAFELLRKCGVLQVVLPGNVLDFNNRSTTSALFTILKNVGKANLSVGRILEGHVNALYLIHLLASEKQKTKWFNGVIVDGDLFGVWNTQGEDGTRFLVVEDDFKLQGSKTFCSGSTLVNKAVVTGSVKSKGKEAWQMAIINMGNIAHDKIDFESWKPLGMKASCSYTVNFSGYHIPKNDLLGKAGDYFKQPYFSGGAIRFAAVQLGGAEAIAYGVLDYLKKLNRTDDPSQQLRISTMMTNITTGNMWIDQAERYFESLVGTEQSGHTLVPFANMMRVAMEEICLQVMEDCNRCIGARGLMEPFAFGRLIRDLTFYLRQPAPDATRLAIAEYFINKGQ